MKEDLDRMFEGLSQKLAQWTKQLRGKKSRVSLLLVIGFLGMGLILLSELLDTPAQEEAPAQPQQQEQTAPEQSLEQRLEEIVGQIDGVGRCSVMVTLKESACSVYATEDSQRREGAQQDGSSESESRLVLIEGAQGEQQPVVEKTVQPQINGVIVVCQGADSVSVRQQVTEAVTTVLGLRSTQVCVCPGRLG